MARMVVIYRTPKDIKEFEKHYWEIHIPMAKNLPGLRKYEVSRGPITTLLGNKDTYLIATLYWDTFADLQKAFASECGQDCAKDRKIFAPDEYVQMFLIDETLAV
jgi:uncharacterized protein (TIGR02118 family)